MEPSWRAQRKQLEKCMRRWMPSYCLPERVEKEVKGGDGGEEEEHEGSRVGDGPSTVHSGAHSSRWWRGAGEEAPPRGKGAGGDEQPVGSKTLLRVLHRRQERRKQERAHQQERWEGGHRGALLERRGARRPQEEGRKEARGRAKAGGQEEGVKDSARGAKRMEARRKIRERELAGTRRDSWAAASEADLPMSPPPSRAEETQVRRLFGAHHAREKQSRKKEEEKQTRST